MEIRACRAVNQSFSTTKSVFLNIIFQIKWEPVNFFISILVPNLLVPLSTPLLIFNLNMDQNKNFITTKLFILKYYIPDKMRTSQPNLLVPLSTPLLIFNLNMDQNKNFITTKLFILKYYIPDKMRTKPNLLVPLSTPLLIFILNKD